MPPSEPGGRPPFDLLRAAFWLLACVITMQVLFSFAAGVMCWLTNQRQGGGPIPGACLPLDQLIREVWDQILVAILALLVARSSPP